MPFPIHYLLQWGGDFVSDPSEIWSNTLRFASTFGEGPGTDTAMTSAQQQTMANSALGIVQSAYGGTDGAGSTNTRVKYAKFNRINDLGNYSNAGQTNEAFVAGAGTPGGAATVHPLTASLVITWRTDAERGPASSGRIFHPQPAVSLSATTYRVPPAKCTSVLELWRAIITGLNSAVVSAGAPAGTRAAVVSRLGGGWARPIKQVEVGDFLDYMGSRRNNLSEARLRSTVIA